MPGAKDERTYGANLQDQTALINSIRSRQREYYEGRPRGGAGRREVFVFELTSTWVSQVANCEITRNDGSIVDSAAQISDPRLYVQDLTVGRDGECYFDESTGYYYPLQAFCTGGGSGGSGGTNPLPTFSSSIY